MARIHAPLVGCTLVLAFMAAVSGAGFELDGSLDDWADIAIHWSQPDGTLSLQWASDGTNLWIALGGTSVEPLASDGRFELRLRLLVQSSTNFTVLSYSEALCTLLSESWQTRNRTTLTGLQWKVGEGFEFCIPLGTVVNQRKSWTLRTTLKIWDDTGQPTLVTMDRIEGPAPIVANAATPGGTQDEWVVDTDTDSDGDGLSDYYERIKYHTDPHATDSDTDGIPDGNWSERREYAYTVSVLVRLRPPFDLASMNDPFQDAKLLHGSNSNGYSTLEVILYPDTEIPLVAAPYPLQAIPDDVLEFLEPGTATHYTPHMEEDVLEIVRECRTDVSVVSTILSWIENRTHEAMEYRFPEVFFTYIADGEVAMRGISADGGRFCTPGGYCGTIPGVSTLLESMYFADSMFEQRVHGQCTSLATLKCAMLKAAGIPSRLIMTIFPLYYHVGQPEPYERHLDRTKWLQGECVYEFARGNGMWSDHAFIEAWLGGQWVRVDRGINIYHGQNNCLSMKILSVQDWSDVDFSQTWPLSWVDHRPYYTLHVEDTEPDN